MSTARTGRPFGSTSGRIPAGGYPKIDAELGGFIAGFIEGEACFSLPKQPKGRNHRCTMSLCVRADDLPLLKELQRRTGLGSIRPVGAHGNAKPRTSWMVAAKSDCRRLGEILDTHPLRGRKSRTYAIWRGALDWWIDGDPTLTHRNRDWSAICYLHSRLSESKRYDPGSATPWLASTADSSEFEEWCQFLAGFFSAEGTLGITVNGGHQMLPRATIAVRADDWPLLLDLRTATGVGRVTREGKQPRNRAPASAWAVRDRQGLSHLVEIFDEHPPRGRRRREYAIWREAVREYEHGKAGPALWARLTRLREGLAAEREAAAAASISLVASYT